VVFFPLDSGFRFGVEGKAGEGWPSWDGAERKQAVLSVAFRYLDTYRELLQEEGERSNSFPKVLAQHTLMEQTHTHTRAHIHTYTHTHTDTHTHTQTHARTRAHIHTHTRTHMHIPVRTYTQIHHERTHKQTSSRTMA
jgi:hypothetical protein